MGCGCGGSKAVAMKSVPTFEIQGDPDKIRYLTELDAIRQKDERNLTGDVVPSVK